jgi:hypothetical protein
MEGFLGKLVAEYEKSATSDEKLAVDDMDDLKDFLGPYRPSRFRSKFVHPYRVANSAVGMADQLIWLNICQQKNLSIPKKNGLMIFIERLDRGGVCNNDGRAL